MLHQHDQREDERDASQSGGSKLTNKIRIYRCRHGDEYDIHNEIAGGNTGKV
jgi:hypothetical protein